MLAEGEDVEADLLGLLRDASATALIRSASVGARPVVGSGVTSLTEKTPNCMLDLRC